MKSDGDKKSLKIRDLVEIPEIRTVIQLEDMTDPRLRKMITETFVLTSETLNNLRSVLTSLSRGEGRGIFLKGHYGSGKSHFLSMLSALLRYPSTWGPVLSQAPMLKDFQENLMAPAFLVVEISLVKHRGSEFLEDIVLRSLMQELGGDLMDRLEGSETRHEAFGGIKEAMKARGYRGLVLLVDELSEFLRSKADGRAFNEDIRFLQYLGEEAAGFPLWVVASLQEWIEETGEIHQDSFNKIKDRYSLRLNLGRAHLEELVSERLIRHKEGAEETIQGIYEELKSYFPTFPVTMERFVRLYPVHPGTSTLLDRLKPLFSEHRGVVDFIHYRLRGDPVRQIPTLLDSPAHRLLTPETIFDHFLDRIRERSETQVFVERVFEGYHDEIPALFQAEDQREVALILIKLLVLFAVSPVKFRYTVRHMTEMLLFQVTSMETEVNYQFILDILERLQREGSYVRVDRRDDPFENHYYLDLKADVAGIMRKRVRQVASGIFPEDRRLFWRLARMVDSPYLPLGAWVERGRQSLSLSWHHTRREGTLLLRQLEEITEREVEALARQWSEGEEDFFLLVGTIHDRDRQYRHVRDHLLPLIRKKWQGMFLFWIPAAEDRDAAWLREVLAAILLLEGEERGTSEKKGAGDEFLRSLVEREKKRLTDHFVDRYFRGTLLWDENQVDLSRYGHLSQEKFLAEFVPAALERRFPRHSRVQPYMDALFPGILREMLMDFLSSGMLVVDDRSKFGIRDILEGLLKPMGLVRKKGNIYELRVSPKQNELARCFLDKIGERKSVPFEEMYRALRKGEYGLMRPQFEILVLALLFSGHLLAYRVTTRKSLEELARTGLKGVTSLSKGVVVGEEMRQAMLDHPLIPRKYKDVPFTLATQEELWTELRSLKAEAVEGLEALKSKTQWAAAFEAFKQMPWERLKREIEGLIAHWNGIKVSLSSKEGLERFILMGREDPMLEKKLRTIENARLFLEQAERILFIYQYVTDSRLKIPEESTYAQEDRRPRNGLREGTIQADYEELGRAHTAILGYFGDSSSLFSPEALEKLFGEFQAFQERYIGAYVWAHQRVRGGGQFGAYEQLTRSRRYKLLQRLDQLELISVEHDRRSIDQGLSSVLVKRCERSPRDHLQRSPVCTCGYRLGEPTPLKPLKEIEKEMDMGISETLDALKSPSVQERVLPYLEGLDLVGKKEEADVVRELLGLSGRETDLFDRLERLVTPQVIQHINKAFQGRVVVVKRDLDQLYRSLIQRKYTLSRLREIFREWLRDEGLSEDTFLHFVGAGAGPTEHSPGRLLREFVESRYGNLADLFRLMGYEAFARAMVTIYWADQYGLGPEEIRDLIPAQGGREDTEEGPGIMELSDMARALRIEKPELFDAIVTELQEAPSFVEGLWASLPRFSPDEIFKKEHVFSKILIEAFQRLLSGRPGTKRVEGLRESRDSTPGKAGAWPALKKRKEEMIRVLELYNLFRRKGAVLKVPTASGPETFRTWESLFVRHLSAIPSLKESLFEGLKRVDVPLPPFLKQEAKTVEGRCREVAEAFGIFYRGALPAWEKGEGLRPFMIEDVPSLLSKKREVPEYRKILYILMDGMRWDLWERIKRDFFGKMPDAFRFVREGSLWSGQPSTTADQMERFSRAFDRAHGEGAGEEMLWRVSGIDEKVHTEKGPLSHLCASVIGYLELELLYRLKDLPSRTLLILFSDHGFLENPGFKSSEKYESPRYIHGKDSPFEVIVPWAWIMTL